MSSSKLLAFHLMQYSSQAQLIRCAAHMVLSGQQQQFWESCTEHSL
jgi:hypothetical protein